MRQVLMSDIRKRMQSLAALTSSFRESHELDWRSMKSMRTADLKRMIETKITSCNEVNLFQVLDMYQAFAERANVSEITKVGLFIANEGIGKVRDAKHTQTLLKRRLTVAQHKLQPHIITNPVQSQPAAVKPQAPVPNPQPPMGKDQAVAEAYNAMLDKAIIYANCDRVIENYNRVSKRFNLEVLINENTRVNGVCDTVVELCNRIDTYQMPTAVKFNTVIETAFYGFESNNINYKKSDILETAIDYFLFKPDGRKSCKEILEATLFFDKNEDMGNIDILMEDEPEQTEEPIDQLLQRHYGDNNISIPVKESKEFEDIFNKFKEDELAKTDKPENKLKGLITKLYSNNVSNIVEDTPDLLKWIRSFFIIGSIAIPYIGPVVAAVGFIADRFISLHVERQEVAKMIKCFEREIKATEKKISSTNDKDEKDKLEKYKDALEKALMKLDMYHTDLLSDEEQEHMYDDIGSDDDELDIDDIDGDGLDDDLLDDDFDFGEFNEFAHICKANVEIGKVLEETLNAYNNNPITEDMIYSIMENADNDTMLDLAYLGAKYPTSFHKDIMKISLESLLSDIRKNKVVLESAIARSVRISNIHSALNILEQIREDDLNDATTVFHGKVEANSLNEAIQGIQLLDSVNPNVTSPLMEASISNTLKLASMKLRKAMTGLKDKDKQISQNIDLSVNNLKKGAEDAMTNDNREAIIQGKILPSASKVIKMAIVNAGLAWLVHPAVAVIGTLGYLGASAKFKSKERQMVIDEIEIELKMCDKYIQIAESKNDMKALKQLMMTKRNLERQLQRVKYKMKVELGQKVYDAPKSEE